MYYTGIDPVSGRSVYVARSPGEKNRQKNVLAGSSGHRSHFAG
jgi:hypothetical protein